MVGQLGHETVFCGAGAVGDAAPRAIPELPGASAHHVGVDVDGVDGVGDADTVVRAQDVAEVTRIALGTIVHKHLVGVNLHAPGREVVFHDGTAQKFVAVFRPVAPEGFGASHLVGRLVEGADDGGSQGACHIAYAEAYDRRFGICLLEGGHFLGDVGKEIILLQFQEVLVDRCHIVLILCIEKRSLPLGQTAFFRFYSS